MASGTWSYVTGEKGRNRVRAFERADSSNLYLEFFDHDPETGERKKPRISTGHSDKDRAKQQADELAAKLADRQPERSSSRPTLRELFDRYLKRRDAQLTDERKRHLRRMRDLFCRFFGGTRKCDSLNREDWDAFIEARTSGAIDARGRDVPEAERTSRSPNTVKKNLKSLRTLLNWGVQADLLAANPTDGYPLPSDEDPLRPRVTQRRYEAMLEVADEVDWRFELALVLAHETGHRIGAIRRLKWSDIDLAHGLIRWRGDEDKSDHEHTTPLSDVAETVLRESRSERDEAEGGWVFPAPSEAGGPCSKSVMGDWWLRAEKLADLEHIERLGWHGLRRKFADELRDAPLKDLADLGGWKTPRTVIEVYQGSDLESMRQAQRQRRTLREGSFEGAN